MVSSGSNPPQTGEDKSSIEPSVPLCTRTQSETNHFKFVATHARLSGALSMVSEDNKAPPTELLQRIIDGYESDPFFGNLDELNHTYAKSDNMI